MCLNMKQKLNNNWTTKPIRLSIHGMDLINSQTINIVTNMNHLLTTYLKHEI